MGAKRVRVDTSLQTKHECGVNGFVGDNDDDRLSQLPDEILINILCFLSINEAARTSVLSSRWTNLWKHTPSLELVNRVSENALREKYALMNKPSEWPRLPGREKESSEWSKFLKRERSNYVKWVNSVIQSHESLTVEEFIIRFPLDKTANKSITQWLEFAFAKQVQSLELNLQNFYGFSNTNKYCFPEEFLTLSSCRPELNFKSLKELSFTSVNLSDGVIEFFLLKCPLLELLIINGTNKISNLQVCGPSLRLKHLKIVSCFGLKTLKVSSPNLTSLWVTMNEGPVLLENVPMLVEVTVACGVTGIYVKHLVSALSCCLSQLEILYLMTTSLKGTNELCNFPKMPKLKKLVITYFVDNGNESLVRLTPLIWASPCLEEFELACDWSFCEDGQIDDGIIIRSPHNHLKVFRFSGYDGRTTDDELLGCIMENCIGLEKIIVDPKGFDGPDKSNAEQTARKKAKEHLEPRVPHHVELVVL